MTATSVPGVRARDYALVNARMERLPNWGLGVPAFVVLGLCYALAFYDIAVIGVTLPAIVGSLHLSTAETAWPVTANLIGYMVGALLLGRLADRFGRRRTLAAVVVIIAVTSVATALSWNALSLDVFRFGAGVGTGAMITMAATLIGEFSPAGSRGRYLARNAFWSTIGNVIPALLAAVLIHENGGGPGWRILLAVPVVIILLLVLFRDSLLPESPRWLAAHGDLARAEKILAGMERRTGVEPLSDEDKAAALAHDEAGEDESAFKPADLLRRPFIGRLAVVFGFWFAFYFTMYAFIAFQPTIIEHLGMPPQNADIITALGFVGSIVAAAAQPLFIDRLERKHNIIIGLAVFIIGLIVLATATNAVLITAGCFLATLGSMLGMIPAYAYTAEIFPVKARASAMGFGDGFGHLGGAVQSFAVLALLGSSGPRVTVWVLGAVLVVGVGFMLLGVRTTGRKLSELSGLPNGQEIS